MHRHALLVALLLPLSACGREAQRQAAESQARAAAAEAELQTARETLEAEFAAAKVASASLVSLALLQHDEMLAASAPGASQEEVARHAERILRLVDEHAEALGRPWTESAFLSRGASRRRGSSPGRARSMATKPLPCRRRPCRRRRPPSTPRPRTAGPRGCSATPTPAPRASSGRGATSPPPAPRTGMRSISCSPPTRDAATARAPARTAARAAAGARGGGTARARTSCRACS
jgi:translation initiation factor IF-2